MVPEDVEVSCLMAVYITGFPVGEISSAKNPGRDCFELFLKYAVKCAI